MTLITACASATKEQQETAMGAGVGALAGVLLKDSRQSAAMGVALGALGGYAGSKNMEVKKQASRKATGYYNARSAGRIPTAYTS